MHTVLGTGIESYATNKQLQCHNLMVNKALHTYYNKKQFVHVYKPTISSTLTLVSTKSEETSKCIYFKVEYRAGTKRKLTTSRIACTHNTVILCYTIIPSPKKSTTPSPILYRLVSLIFLSWELLCVAYITVLCVQAILDVISFLFVPTLYSTLRFRIIILLPTETFVCTILYTIQLTWKCHSVTHCTTMHVNMLTFLSPIPSNCMDCI